MDDAYIDKEKLNVQNEEAWNEDPYDAWIKRFGEPKEAAKKILLNPKNNLSAIYDYFGSIKGKKIMNLMGSNGNKAVALALLGAEVTVADFSEGNRRYALELAKEAGVSINYILGDVLELADKIPLEMYDVVFAEMGILHYFTDLKPFMSVVNKLLKKGGTFIIRDFHPVSTKLITSRGTTAKVRKHKVTGDYFDTSIEEKNISYSKYLEGNKSFKVYLRRWNLGEIVTAIADEGLFIKSLREEPNMSSEVFDKGIPKTFTIVANRKEI